MKLQNLIIIFIIIILPIILILSLYISNGLKTIQYQSIYDNGLVSATSDALYAFELNTANDNLSDNPEIKRDILNASIKMFEKSLCNTCNVSSYNTSEIEEYIPAIVFGMYDGFYMYAPSYNSNTGKYEHSLKNYVYYSETIIVNNKDIIITYSLDNYITVCGDFGNGYEIKKGYLINLEGTTDDGKKYKGINIDENDSEAIKYYKDAYAFTHWFLNASGVKSIGYLNISSANDPEDPNSAFVQHKRQIIKNKLEGVLNSNITAYSNRTWGQNYKMPKLSDEDWEKIYSNISMLTFFQGKQNGFTKYNGYAVVNSTNNTEYVNSCLMYFIDENGVYHDIRCDECKNATNLTGYKIGSFERKTVENDDGTKSYIYEHNEQACYKCINWMLATDDTVYNYVNSANDKIKTAYWTSLGRERLNDNNKITQTDVKITFDINGGNIDLSSFNKVYKYGEKIQFPQSNELKRQGYTFGGWSKTSNGEVVDASTQKAYGSTTYYAKWQANTYTIRYDGNGATSGNTANSTHTYNQYKSLTSNGYTKTGYKFLGWSTTKGGTVEYIDKDNVSNISDGTDKTLYAVWGKIITVDVNERYNGGTEMNGGYGTFKVWFDGQESGVVSDFYLKDVYIGTMKIIQVTPNSGYTFTGITVYTDGVKTGTYGIGDTIKITGDTRIVLEFK